MSVISFILLCNELTVYILRMKTVWVKAEGDDDNIVKQQSQKYESIHIHAIIQA